MSAGKMDVLLGLQWGDEGKGKIVYMLGERYDIIARFQGGPNAGHTVFGPSGEKLVLHSIPSGVFWDRILNLMGDGMVSNPISQQEEISLIQNQTINFLSRLRIGLGVNLILPTHILLDEANEAVAGKDKIGTTGRGIGPSYEDKYGRRGLSMEDILGRNFRSRYDNLKNRHCSFLRALKFRVNKAKH